MTILKRTKKRRRASRSRMQNRGTVRWRRALTEFPRWSGWLGTR